MLIKYLRIEKDTEVIRHIKFKDGANLIVDSTPSENIQESGNNVGKTTVLKLVDYCLGAKAKHIYQDSEFKTNSKIKDFLESSNVLITLCLGISFDTDENDILIKRNFLKRSEKICKINGEDITNEKDFQIKLKELLFNSVSGKPTFRELIPRYIRSDAGSMDRVLKYLHQTTTDNTYEGIYRFLLTRTETIELSAEKNSKAKTIGFNKDVIKKTFKSRTASEIEQHLALINNDKELKQVLQDYRKSLHSFSMNERVITTERGKNTSAQVIVNMLCGWYQKLDFQGCSSHSGRRTFITNAARKISTVGGSIRDVQALARHSSLQMTQRYIECDVEAQKKVVQLI